MSCLYACVSVTCVPGACGDQKTASDSLQRAGYALPCQELHLASLEVQSMLLNAEPTLQAQFLKSIFKILVIFISDPRNDYIY